MKKAKQENSEGDGAGLSEGEEEQESAREVFKDEEFVGEKGDEEDDEDDEECDGPELPSGLTGEEEPPLVSVEDVCLFVCQCFAVWCVCVYAFFFSSGAFEDQSFASLVELVSENTLKGVKEMGFENMTEIQHKTIRPLLEGR